VVEHSDNGYGDFSEVPWFRRSLVNLAFAVAGLIIPPFLWFVCFVLFTGDVYTPRKDDSGKLKTWGPGSKWVVLIVAGLQIVRWLRGQGSALWSF
jgi:hypothetical protein